MSILSLTSNRPIGKLNNDQRSHLLYLVLGQQMARRNVTGILKINIRNILILTFIYFTKKYTVNLDFKLTKKHLIQCLYLLVSSRKGSN